MKPLSEMNNAEFNEFCEILKKEFEKNHHPLKEGILHFYVDEDSFKSPYKTIVRGYLEPDYVEMQNSIDKTFKKLVKKGMVVNIEEKENK
jgi:hypothetical protein